MHGDASYSRLFRARPLRFVLPMRKPSPNTPMERNLITIKTVHQSVEGNGDETSVDRRPSYDAKGNADDIRYDASAKSWRDEHRNVLRKKPAAHRLPNGNIFVKPELLCDVGCETPRINTDFHLGKEYRYFYAIACDMDLNNPGTVGAFYVLYKPATTRSSEFVKCMHACVSTACASLLEHADNKAAQLFRLAQATGANTKSHSIHLRLLE